AMARLKLAALCLLLGEPQKKTRLTDRIRDGAIETHTVFPFFCGCAAWVDCPEVLRWRDLKVSCRFPRIGVLLSKQRGLWQYYRLTEKGGGWPCIPTARLRPPANSQFHRQRQSPSCRPAATSRKGEADRPILKTIDLSLHAPSQI